MIDALHHYIKDQVENCYSKPVDGNERDLRVVCSVDCQFRPREFRFELDRLMELVGHIKACKGRVIEDVVYEPDPLCTDIESPKYNPMGNTGRFKLILKQSP